MKSKILKLRIIFYAPVVIAGFRAFLTILILGFNPQGMPVRYLQIIPMITLACSCFAYMKLFSDGDPVVSLILPTLVHMLIAYLVKGKLVIVPFLIPLIFDAAYLVVKGYKASAYPFEIEGNEETKEEFPELEIVE